MAFIDGTAPPTTQVDRRYTSAVLLTTLCISGLVGMGVGAGLAASKVLGLWQIFGIAFGLPMASTLIAYTVIKVREHLKTPEKPEHSKTYDSSLHVEVKEVIYRKDSEGNRFITEKDL